MPAVNLKLLATLAALTLGCDEPKPASTPKAIPTAAQQRAEVIAIDDLMPKNIGRWQLAYPTSGRPIKWDTHTGRAWLLIVPDNGTAFWRELHDEKPFAP